MLQKVGASRYNQFAAHPLSLAFRFGFGGLLGAESPVEQRGPAEGLQLASLTRMRPFGVFSGGRRFCHQMLRLGDP
jgi:hypothetical protein